MIRSMRLWHLVWVALCMGCLACSSTPGKSQSRSQSGSQSGSQSSGDPIKTMNADQLREMGEKFMAADDVPNAMRYLTAADQKQPNDPLIQYDLGDAYDARGMPEKALEYFQLALKLKPDYSEALNALGKVYGELGRTEEALQAFQQALNNPLYPTPHYALYNIGLLYETQNNPQMALTFYQRASQANKSYAAAYYRAGKILEATGKKEEAREAFGHAIQIAPNMAEAHFDFARLSYQVRDYTAAHFSFSRVVKLAPNTPMATEAGKYVQALEAQFPQ
jgi:type IV pilus assembly protein PilF